ncbi:MAG: hypothetical protein EPN79_11250 [Burkholderiaceae bacterium]|nr:MAG: hypothetical protein EPN79_11250 [Burkholderiaceae bacterium]TBR76741.1 MAG: hypothetical protein EPN64_05825 [Burkholderiaceae bacterium]
MSNLRPSTFRHLARIALCASFTVISHSAFAQTQALTMDALMNAQGSSASEVHLSLVRETVLRETAFGLGTRLGLLQRSKEIFAEVNQRKDQLDKEFNFGGLMMGPGVLPPVIMESHDAVSLEATTMRVSGSIYKIEAPARFVAVAPTWRDWLFLGLPREDSVNLDSVKALLPRDGAEKAFWKQELAKAVASGRSQAQQIFDSNVASLEKTYFGMRLFYDLYKRGMVSIPVIASSQSMIDHESPNTIDVGNTMFRITRQTGFEDAKSWKPLE